jgi:hypothetical protein
MLAKYWRLRMRWDADQTLTYDNGARIAIRCGPWKIASGNLSYGTVITEDLGFGAGETIADEGQVEGSVVDNTSNLFWGIKGIFQLTADANSTDGTAYLYLEESDDNSTWPSDADDFEITDLRSIATLTLSTDAEDEDRMTNFSF